MTGFFVLYSKQYGVLTVTTVTADVFPGLRAVVNNTLSLRGIVNSQIEIRGAAANSYRIVNQTISEPPVLLLEDGSPLLTEDGFFIALQKA